MASITLPKIEYESLKKKALLYEQIFRFFPERIFGTESYSPRRIKEFLREDKLDRKTASRLKKLIR